ncbi:BrnA antitoxin family protein [soil metagenome]
MSNKERIVRYTGEEIDEMIKRGESKTDWARVDALTEEELEASSDLEEEGEFDWDNVHVGIPPAKKQLTVRFDEDVIAWFRAQGAGYQTRMNQVLRSYVEAQRGK